MESVRLEATTRVTDIGIQRKPSDVGSAAVSFTLDTFLLKTALKHYLSNL